MTAHAQSNVFGFACTEYYLGLKFACPENGTVAVGNDVASLR
jgi:hypothetical protein